MKKKYLLLIATFLFIAFNNKYFLISAASNHVEDLYKYQCRWTYCKILQNSSSLMAVILQNRKFCEHAFKRQSDLVDHVVNFHLTFEPNCQWKNKQSSICWCESKSLRSKKKHAYKHVYSSFNIKNIIAN